MAEYINRELLKKRFLKRLDWLKKDIHDEYSGALYDCCEVDAGLIDEIPAADVAPVVHARWAHLGGDEWCCSVCGFVITTEGSWDKPTKKYCEDCGAKMDGGADHEAD